ncbi:MAG TPA: sugar-binding protein [Pyrinomonadaceae bacterium]|nr:sugar-binding protein [Pyrinomonadaceae bacterium]
MSTDNYHQTATEPVPPAEPEIRAALSAIIGGRQFQGAGRLASFLNYIVQETLKGNDHYLKEYVLGTEVFGRAADYDPRIDPIVRNYAVRLRKKLEEYYAENPDACEVIISLPKGHYVPVFSRRTETLRQSSTESTREHVTEQAVEFQGASLPAHDLNNDTPTTDENFRRGRFIRWWSVAIMMTLVAIGTAFVWAFLNRFERRNSAASAETSLSGSAQAAQVAIPPEIDGLPDTVWGGRIDQRVEKKLKGGLSLSASFGVLWDVANLYLMVEVRDDGQGDSAARKGDEVEIYLDTGNQRQRSYRAHNFQFILPVQGGTPTEQNRRTAGVRMATVQENWGYRMEAAIPWTTLAVTGEAGRKLGFDLGVSRRDKDDSLLMWHGTADNWFDPSGFGNLILASDLVNAAMRTVLPSAELQSSAGQENRSVLRVISQTNGEAGVIIRFELPSLPARVLSAKLRLYCAGLKASGRGQVVRVYGKFAMNGQFDAPEDQGPSSFQSAILISAPATWYEWDVTPVVRQAVERRSRHIEMTLRARDAGDTGNGWADIAGGSASGQEPRLALEY